MYRFGDSIQITDGRTLNPGDTVTISFDYGRAERTYTYVQVLEHINRPGRGYTIPFWPWEGLSEDRRMAIQQRAAQEINNIGQNVWMDEGAAPVMYGSALGGTAYGNPYALGTNLVYGTASLFQTEAREFRRRMYYRWQTDLRRNDYDRTLEMRTRIFDQNDEFIEVYYTRATIRDIESYPDETLFIRHLFERHIYDVRDMETAVGRGTYEGNIPLPRFEKPPKIPKRLTHSQKMQMAINDIWHKIIKEEAEESALELLGVLIGEKELEVYKKTGLLYVYGKRHLWGIQKTGDVSIYRRNHRQAFCVSLQSSYRYPPTDNVIAIKAFIETDERAFLKIANETGKYAYTEKPPGACKLPIFHPILSLKDHFLIPHFLS